MRWARAEAERIVSGEADGDFPMGIFTAAQRMEHELTRWQWLEDDFPGALADFVFGWNISGPETEAQILDAARELVADDSGDGPPVAPRDPLY